MKKKNKLDKRQQVQESEYVFPYHYLDLKVEIYKYVHYIEYLTLIKIVKNLLKPFKGQKILDVGCGDGRFCFELNKENVKITGIDYSKRALVFAKAFNPNIRFFRMDIKQLKIKNRVDQIVLIETLEHIPPSHVSSVLKALSETLVKKGKLIITVPSTNRKKSDKHYQHFSEESLENALTPFFQKVKIIGYGKTGFIRLLFINLKRLGIFLYLFDKFGFFTKKYFKFLKCFYRKNLATGKPEECLGLIAICEK